MSQELSARIVYWGIQGAGVSTNLHAIYSKLRADHRGELRRLPTRLDPTVTYEVLPIELGELGGVRTRIHVTAVPGSPEQAPTRKQLLDQVDGLVLVVDAQRSRIEENVAAFEELRQALAAYGRALHDLPVVVQYNKRDLADPYAIEELHKKLDLPGVAVFETVASEGSGVLQTLTTISKRVVRALRDGEATPQPITPPAEPVAAPPRPVPAAPAAAQPAARPPAPAAPTSMDTMILLESEDPRAAQAAADTVADARTLLDQPWDSVSKGGLEIVGLGVPEKIGPRALRIPIELADATGETHTLALTLNLDES